MAVHIHSYSAAGTRETYVYSSVVAAGNVMISVTFQTPGLILPSEIGEVPLSFPPYFSVRNTYRSVSLYLYLPVTAASQALSTQHLLKEVKSLWVIRIPIIFFIQRHSAVAL